MSDHYTSSPDSPIFALKNLPDVIRGALFSRYSRSKLGLRSLLVKEFLAENGLEKAQSFYDRILDGYGDDSIGELGGAHLALEQISIMAANEIERARIGGSPLEKSTRYLAFDEKNERGEYAFVREPTLMRSKYAELYVKTCNALFDAYAELAPQVLRLLEERNPPGGDKAKQSALRAHAFDVVRGLLPTSTMTNMGLFGNGRFFEMLLHKLQAHECAELRTIAESAFEELSRSIPSFIRRATADHPHHQAYVQFWKEQKALLKAQRVDDLETDYGAHLVRWDADAVQRVTAGLLAPYGGCAYSEEESAQLFEQLGALRKNRRHKSPRGLEHTFFTFEIVADFGIFRDLQRHRMMTQERQRLGCALGYYVPEEIQESNLKISYVEALEQAKEAYAVMAQDFPNEAEYVVPMAFNVRWTLHANLRALQWMCELRSSPAGHVGYRRIAQQMARSVIERFPAFEHFFGFVNWEGETSGRLEQERRTLERK